MLSGRPPFQASSTPAMLMKHFSERPVDLAALNPEIPDDLAAIVMRLLEKKPEHRFSSGGEVVKALAGDARVDIGRPRETRTVQAERGVEEPESGDAGRKRRKLRFREKPLAERVRITRSETLQWAGWGVFFASINFFTGADFPWFVFPTLGIGLGVWEKVSGLLAEGVSMSVIYGRAAARRAESASPVVDAAARYAPRELLEGRFGATLRRAADNYRSVAAHVEGLSSAHRALLPGVEPIARELLDRVVSIAAAMDSLDSELDVAKIRVLDERVAAAEREASGDAESERRLSLLRKQRSSWRELGESRSRLHARFESASLMLENLALDVLRLRSAGLQSALGEVNNTTQEARALIRDIGHVAGAVDELRALESEKGDGR
jgi:hypothetical protein